MMKLLQATYFPVHYKAALLPEVSTRLDLLKKEAIGINPWGQYPYKPAVDFSVGHAGDYIFIKYYVAEQEVKTNYKQTNDPVYQDSCVEFFIAFQDTAGYYNFEFNSNGVCLAGFGEKRLNRQALSPEIIQQIDVLRSEPKRGKDKNYYWDLCLAFPLTVFCHHQLQDISGKTFTANFYKCGDHLAEPHFMVWNNILSKEPDFHLPEYFGALCFENYIEN